MMYCGPLDWHIEVCIICGCQLGPGIGSHTGSGRCVNPDHHSAGGCVVRVQALPVGQQDGSTQRYLPRLSYSLTGAKDEPKVVRVYSRGVCKTCGKEARDHPQDPFFPWPTFVLLCNGTHAKV